MAAAALAAVPAYVADRERRGTKRVCKTCAERFYDLGRDPAVCPMCHASVALAEYARPAAPASGYGSSWSTRRPAVHTILPAEEAAPEAVDLADEAAEEEEAPATTDDTILEQEDEVADDVADLLAPDAEEPSSE